MSVGKTVLNKTNDNITHIISYGEITFPFRINISILTTCEELGSLSPGSQPVIM